ncbi:MAG: hypothetical protein COB62_02935 [Piscirickettsiaceae bacterium]|nr:MAG: hypothetical protein COB62_02935 [Piscirickettsiaceae bacterium]
MKKIAYLLVILVVVMTSGCAHLSAEKKFEKLQATQKLFWKSLRWKSYDTAVSVIRFRNPARQLAAIDDLDKITISNYEETASLPTAEEDVYTIVVLFSYVQNETGRLLQVKHKEIWWYDKESKRWFLDSDMPNFKVE